MDRTAEDVAGHLLAFHHSQLADGKLDVPSLTAEPHVNEVWVTYQVSDRLSGTGETTFGLVIDVVADMELYCDDTAEGLAETVYFGEIKEPQGDPAAGLADGSYVLRNGVYWRGRAPQSPLP